jgi:hypothetical protein
MFIVAVSSIVLAEFGSYAGLSAQPMLYIAKGAGQGLRVAQSKHIWQVISGGVELRIGVFHPQSAALITRVSGHSRQSLAK